MHKMILDIRSRSKASKAKVVLPEAMDTRIQQAAAYIIKEGLAEIILLGDRDKIVISAKEKGIDLASADIVDPVTSPRRKEFANELYELRKHKGMTEQEADSLLVEKPVFFGAMCVRAKEAGGFVAGAVHTTRDVARAVLYCIGLDRDIKTMSSSFLMILDDESFGANGVLVFADCAVVPDPTAEQLSCIAISASDLMHETFGLQPRIAVLSYSSKGSGDSPNTKDLIEAVKITRQRRPDLMIDGELQVDAALVPEVAKTKVPDSPLAGRANVLVFPSLEAGNISYKLVQRLANARALGPLLNGPIAPCSDLSRGCSVDDIIDTVCVTAIRSAAKSKR